MLHILKSVHNNTTHNPEERSTNQRKRCYHGNRNEWRPVIQWRMKDASILNEFKLLRSLTDEEYLFCKHTLVNVLNQTMIFTFCRYSLISTSASQSRRTSNRQTDRHRYNEDTVSLYWATAAARAPSSIFHFSSFYMNIITPHSQSKPARSASDPLRSAAEQSERFLSVWTAHQNNKPPEFDRFWRWTTFACNLFCQEASFILRCAAELLVLILRETCTAKWIFSNCIKIYDFAKTKLHHTTQKTNEHVPA